ncbi:MAG: TetR/AcrR family transcriptional regulator [Myxococcota bacterium]|nr:TetR/AcrR family transcriptional regulator [Myxococcota bacterium]
MPNPDTREQLLDVAQGLVQERGFNAFSFKDLAREVGIRTPSVHYHFETKGDLGEALIRRYREQLEDELRALEGRRTARSRLRALIEMYRSTEQKRLACLCGSLASDIDTLPEALRPHVGGYLDRTEEWIAEQIQAGTSAGEFEPAASAADLAVLLMSGLQGALFLGRVRAPSPGPSMLSRVERAFWKLLEG